MAATPGDTLDPSPASAPSDPVDTPTAEVRLTDGVVLLRRPTEADVEQITAACQDERLQRYLPVPRPYGLADAEAYVVASRRAWEDGRKAAFAIVDPADPTHLWGMISMSIAGSCGNCGYWTVPAVRGWGVARRALVLLCDWGFAERGLAIVLAEINTENESSARVARGAGFHRSHEIPVEPGSPTGETERILYLRLVSDPPPEQG
jgi:RimJ/RimL family protein N-acetyltransferase